MKNRIARPPVEVLDNIPLGRIAESPIHVYGLFAKQALKAGELLGILDGQEVDWRYYHRLRDAFDLSEQHKNLFFFRVERDMGLRR